MGVLRATFQRLAMRKVTGTTPMVLAVLCLCLLGRHTASGTFCGVDSRPHPKGICGSKLIRALQNLCFLLSHEYPSIFSRSIHKRSLKNIDDIPLDTLAQMELPGAQNHHMAGTGVNADTMRKLFLSLMPRVQSLMPEMGATSSGLTSQPSPGGPEAGKRAGDNDDLAPHVQKRTMVCECCYNACQATTLAQYCP